MVRFLNRQGAKVAKEGMLEPQMNADERRLSQKRNCYSAGDLFSSSSLVVVLLILSAVAGFLSFDLLQIAVAYARVFVFGARSGGGNAQSFVFNIPNWIPVLVWFFGSGLLIYKEWMIDSVWLKVAINAAGILLIMLLLFALLIVGVFA